MGDRCNVGDTVYRLSKNGIMETKVIAIDHYPHAVYRLEGWSESYFDRAFGKTLFLTMEDANNAIRIKTNIAKKRELLKEYERKLNAELNIGDHFIVK